MKKPELAIPDPKERNGESAKAGHDDGRFENLSPIRKQSRDIRRRYMREYMRMYRLAHPGLSTPYVRKFRAKHNLK